MHEVVTSQLFWPESGLQVPHVGGEGFARAIVAVRRTATVVKCIIVVVSYRWTRYELKYLDMTVRIDRSLVWTLFY